MKRLLSLVKLRARELSLITVSLAASLLTALPLRAQNPAPADLGALSMRAAGTEDRGERAPEPMADPHRWSLQAAGNRLPAP